MGVQFDFGETSLTQSISEQVIKRCGSLKCFRHTFFSKHIEFFLNLIYCLMFIRGYKQQNSVDSSSLTNRLLKQGSVCFRSNRSQQGLVVFEHLQASLDFQIHSAGRLCVGFTLRSFLEGIWAKASVYTRTHSHLLHRFKNLHSSVYQWYWIVIEKCSQFGEQGCWQSYCPLSSYYSVGFQKRYVYG